MAKPAPTKPDLEQRTFATARAFETWLRRHHASVDGVWLRLAKGGSPEPTVSYPEAIEIALCHGWIDGQRKAHDAHFWLQRFTPRRAKSIWSKINVAKAMALVEAGRMQPAGQAQIEAAQADGRWAAAYDGARAATAPDDLRAALAAEPPAAVFFESLDGANRYAVLWRIQTAKTPETRAKRIAQLVEMLARGDTIHP